MTKDFAKHQQLISRFRGLTSQQGFDAKYNSVTTNLVKTEKFLLKMELKRLASACTRAIDLRGLVDGECQLFDYHGQSHFLDVTAIKVFNENIQAYGSYTFGVYEAVQDTKNNFRNIYQNEQSNVVKAERDNVSLNTNSNTVEKLQYPVKLYCFDNYPDRNEERMNFAIALTLTLSSNKKIQATSIDLSASGIKFRLVNEKTLVKGEVFSIVFTGFEQDFQFSKDELLTYQVQNTYRDNDTQLIGCSRLDLAEKDSFSQFLSGYIQGNKRRYKINLTNSLSALQARCYEQFSLVKLNELAIFMQASKTSVKEGESTLKPRYALTTRNNQHIYHYWQNENKHSTLNYLIDAKRFSRLKWAKKQGQTLLVYSFIHQHKGNSFFYTFDDQQLQEDEAFFSKFLAFAASKESFAITLLDYHSINSEQGYSPYALSNTLSKKQSYLNPPLSDEVKETLATLPYVITACDLTHTTNIADYQRLGFEGLDLKKVKQYGHKRYTKKLALDEISINYTTQRQEPRFKYQTPVEVGSELLNWSGVSEDFSVSGLKIELKEASILSVGDIVYLSFPKLQKITSTFDLKMLPYRVVRLNKNKTIINLRVLVKEHQHIGRSFFKLLIEKNKSKLTPDEYAMLIPGLSAALRTLYAVNSTIPSAMIQSSGARYKVEVLAAGKNSAMNHSGLLADMRRLSDRNSYYNLYPLLGNLQVSQLLEKHLKKILPTDKAHNDILYIGIRDNVEQVDKAVSVKLASDLEDPESKRFFIKRSLKQGKFYCISLNLSRSDKPQMEHLNPELSYISSYAIHRGKQIEQEILSVVGLLQLVDITQEVLLRYRLES